MKIGDSILRSEEKAVFALRELYGRYVYSLYKMSKFEEYDLYVRNKNFLISDNIITFNDRNGKLMALKPDVTLSIIKNLKNTENCVNRVCYNESVYRVQKGGDGFKEITQVGLECVGATDEYCISEVLALALESLKLISDDFVLDVSHLGVLSAVLDGMGVSEDERAELLHCVSEKNPHGIDALCASVGIPADKAAVLKKLVSLYGEPSSVLAELRSIVTDSQGASAISELERVLSVINKNVANGRVRVDFSVINDMSYYNGIVFRGFINGIPTGILSGGQYDLLMQKMGKKAGAIGFAVYPDLLKERAKSGQYDVDALLLYGEDDTLEAISAVTKSLIDSGKSVTAQKSVPEKLRYKELFKVSKSNESGVELLETNA